ncbi:hypothetical protein KUTeg_023724 [Tegillarca granosa]|uniref:LNR domain-containing protein n=1 Tax=Tegillarca granosa TaxID=220873 RepID=A0ABQ9E2W1_TEGGR|nr:hypothetical protein KUTeg_023724 [Tegillarca granosa]
MQGRLKKVVQKQAYDIISHRYGILIVLGAIVIVTVSAFHFGEALLEWSHEKYAVVFNSYSDNLAGRSFRERLCLPVPIDIVYTWVNGTDPLLLNQLRNFKRSMESELNVSREEKCVFPNCLATNMVILDPVLPPDMTLTKLSDEYPVFSKATSMKEISSHLDDSIKYTVIYFSDENEVKEAMSTNLMINQFNTTVKRGFITSDWTVHNSILMSEIIMMSGFPYKLSEEDIKQKLQQTYSRGIDKVELYSEKGVAVIHSSDKEVVNQILTASNITIDGKEPTFNAANLVWDLRDFSRDDDISASRFEDNEELRYSLRSVEKYAPWVRHIYIITNGQIPHWLNLESPRVTIVTHSDLFLNKSHLPTFSSPAIESHIHRIPGLSQKFIYMNDDVMFGKEVWPDDFYSHSTGQKVYLTWPVPNCNEGCPSSWIKDGYCDKACNNTECEWDGGDCSGDNSRPGVGNWGRVDLYGVSEQQYCNKGCANSWLADRYCDTSCNVAACGFDVGDCGTSNYHKLYQIDLLKSIDHYSLPPGEIMGYFNLSSLIPDKGGVDTASYRKSDVIRVATVGQKFKVMTFILYPGHNATILSFQLKYHLQNVTNKQTINFTLSVDTKLKKEVNTTSDTVEIKKTNKTLKNVTQDLAETYVVYDVPENKQFPHMRSSDHGIVEPLPANINMSTYVLPQHLNEEFNSLLQEFHDGELTEKGFNYQTVSFMEKIQGIPYEWRKSSQ